MNPMFLTTLPLVGVDLGTVFWTLINTLIIVLIYRFFLHNKVVVMLDKRNELISKDIDSAKTAREAAEKAEAEYTSKLARSREEAQEIISAATSRAAAKEQEIITEANENAAVIRERAEESIELEKKRALNEIKGQISELVIMTASAVAQREIKEEDNKAIIENFLVKV